MSLRYRLFLWVAVVFTIAFVVSFYWEEHATEKSLQKTYQELLGKLDELNKQKIQAIEDYLADMLYKIQAEVDAVLQGVSRYDLIREGFIPSSNQNWLDSASLMITNKWIDFIQSTSGEELMSEIIIDTNRLNDTLHFPVNEAFHLVGIRSLSEPDKWEGPYIGIPLDISSLHGEAKGVKEADESYYVFFTPNAILKFSPSIDTSKSLNLSINLLEPFLKWLELPAQQYYLKSFLDKIAETQKYLRESPEAIPKEEHWKKLIKRKLVDLPGEEEEDEKCFAFLDESEVSGRSTREMYYQRQVKYYVKEYIEHYNKVGLIWGLTTLSNSNIFGRTPLSADSPIGMGIMNKKSRCGKALESRSVFFSEPKYQVEKALQKMATLPSDFLTTHLDVIAPSDMHHVFFGNTLRLKEGGKTGYLTIGTHGKSVLESLSRSTHQTSVFISGGKIIAIADSKGEEVSDSTWFNLPVETLVSQNSGLVTVDGKEYFFLHIAPYKRLDLHFFIFEPKAEEYAFINSLRDGAKKIVSEISFQMRLASIGGLLFVLILLNNIAKRITRPITHLAEVTETVAKGKLDDIEIPEETKKTKHDEVYSLYHSFFEMVKGLREKERVRGILNKVVSEEIAEEALKGNIQLGGEEKKVTVLFADIRGFSKMTENMAPKEVIQLINTCMTKVSQKIDAHGGVIDKYVGDEVMALFGAPIESAKSALQAIRSAIDMLDEIKKWNTERTEQGLPTIEMGIGIHTGNVVAGNMGAEDRLNYTVLGANVNLASRICSKAEGMKVFISESTLESEGVKDQIEYEKLEPVELKGFTKPIPIYSVISYKKESFSKSSPANT
ncbi:MAG: hypothetical protein KDK76_00415 [Chlamydiia bacterium]|nr:hypothetical protein [Chlamydiia bacterium]